MSFCTERKNKAWLPHPKSKRVVPGRMYFRTMPERHRQMNRSSALKSLVPTNGWVRVRSRRLAFDAFDHDSLKFKETLVDRTEHQAEGKAHESQQAARDGDNRAGPAFDVAM